MKDGKLTNILFTWIGYTDIKSMQANLPDEHGPIAQALKYKEYDYVELISNYEKKLSDQYLAWLQPQSKAKVTHHHADLTSPVNFGEIYQNATVIINAVKKQQGNNVRLTFHLSPGTPAMAAVWIILAKTRFAAELIESSKEHGVKVANVPFDISAEFIPDLMKQADQRITQLSSDNYVVDKAFVSVIHQSESMKRVIQKAQKIAPRTLPVLIEGESGTGKEVLARSIHEASLRHKNPFVAVNCGAINKELAESEFFGHKKGSFTGASADRKGYFESANQGTLFLDEIGELPLELQVKLLRALQEQEITPVGASKPIKIDTRIIAATNRNLIQEVKAGSFREDLFYRIAVAVISLPALRERQGDLNLLIDYFLERINTESTTEPNYEHKELSVSARNIMLQHDWPGNIRELSNTLLRATIWSEDKKIDKEDIKEAILEMPNTIQKNDNILNKDLSAGIDLQGLIASVATHYLEKALQETHGNKSKATELLGLGNYQTLNNWLKKYDIK